MNAGYLLISVTVEDFLGDNGSLLNLLLHSLRKGLHYRLHPLAGLL